jgi:hypothetical protein
MPVAFAAGDFLIDLRPGTWDIGEVKDCEVATNKGKELLLCGTNMSITWSMLSTEERSGGEKGSQATAHKSEIYLTAKTFPVTFHGENTPLVLSTGERFPKAWKCQRIADGIDCR